MAFDDDDDSSSFFPNKRNYDVNSKIMLTAIISLSFVVVLVTLLHIYARCVLRRQARRRATLRGFITASSANIHTSTIEPPKHGLDPSVIAALPIFMFKQTEGDSSSSVECAVCLSMLEDAEMARTLPNCKHTFHAECIDKWFGSNSTCPNCRTEAEPRLVLAEPREGVVAAAGTPPSAPPLEGPQSEGGGGTQPSAPKAISGSSSSRLSSFRRILSRERSSRRMQTQSCGEELDGLPADLERQ